MEEELKRPVSLGEVFMKPHTRADGSYVDQKAKQVAEVYEKNIEEILSQMDFDVPNTSEHSSEQSTHRTLSIQEKDDIFLKSTVTGDRGTPFGLGRLGEKINKGKRKESCGSSSSSSLLEIQEQLQSARRRIAEQDAENARHDEEQRNAQTRISSLEMLVSYLRNNDPGFDNFMANIQPPATVAATATATTAAATTPANAQANAPLNASTTSPLSNGSSSSPLAS